ncbi:MAG: hypothetical protein WCI61_09230, partial [Chloroflexota bacterium]
MTSEQGPGQASQTPDGPAVTPAVPVPAEAAAPPAAPAPPPFTLGRWGWAWIGLSVAWTLWGFAGRPLPAGWVATRPSAEATRTPVVRQPNPVAATPSTGSPLTNSSPPRPGSPTSWEPAVRVEKGFVLAADLPP